MHKRRWWVAGLLATLLIASLGSWYASAHPDGLEYVAQRAGFADAAKDSPAANGPLADYQTEGVDDPRLSGALAGVVGALVVLGLGGGLFWVLRRRPPQDAPSDSADSSSRSGT